MIHFARVIDNSEFETTGTIRVVLFEKSNMYDLQNLANKPEIIKRMREDFLDDKWVITSCYVSNVFGGGFDYGTFHLPQVNSIGVVSMVDIPTDDTTYVWMGGLNIPVSINDENGEDRGIGEEIFFENLKVHNKQTLDCINIPSADNNKEFSQNKNGVSDNKFTNDLLKDSFIIKTKKTSNFEDFDNPSEENKNRRDFRKIPADSMAIFGKKELSLTHNDVKEKEDSFIIDNTTILKMDKDGFQITYNRDDDDGTILTSISIDKNGDFTITKKPKKDGEAEINILSTREKLFTQILDGRKNSSTLEIYPKKMILENIQNNVGSSVSVEGKNITINATGNINLQTTNGTINCGTSGLPVLLAPKDAIIIDNQVKIGEQSFTISQTLHG